MDPQTAPPGPRALQGGAFGRILGSFEVGCPAWSLGLDLESGLGRFRPFTTQRTSKDEGSKSTPEDSQVSML